MQNIRAMHWRGSSGIDGRKQLRWIRGEKMRLWNGEACSPRVVTTPARWESRENIAIVAREVCELMRHVSGVQELER